MLHPGTIVRNDDRRSDDLERPDRVKVTIFLQSPYLRIIPGRTSRPGTFSDSSGCSPAACGMAEIIPVEPEQGNACAGKVVKSFTIPPFCSIPPRIHFKVNSSGNYLL
jgi:hypothetical protein